jgi:hypothetical protein
MNQSSNGRSLVLHAVALVALVAGCISPGSAVCSDERTCPPNTRCDVERHLCVGEAQEVACAGHAEGEVCLLAGVKGNCRAGLCALLFCGDGMRTGTESCDGADLAEMTCGKLGYYSQTTGLKCGADCKFDTSGCTGACGDKMINGSELCDGSELGGADCRTAGFYDAPGLRCSPSCTLDVSACTGFCGDGKTNGPEQCDGAPPVGQTCVDYGFDRGRLGCSALCGPLFDECEQMGWKSVLLSERHQNFNAVWGSGPNDMFAVGQNGVIVRGSGTTWSAMTSGTEAMLTGVWGSGPDDVFAVGDLLDGTILHWNGTTWSTMSPPPAHFYGGGIWGSGPNDVFAVGSPPNDVVHWDGTSWSVSRSCDDSDPHACVGAKLLNRVWGSGPNDVFAVGDGIVHWDGMSWSEMSTPDPSPDLTLAAVWGSGPNDVFVVGSPGIIHWNGTSWSKMDSGPPMSFLSVWGSGPNDVLALGTDDTVLGLPSKMVHWDGTSWSETSVMKGGHGEAIWGAGPTDVYVAGGDGIQHRNGDSWFATSSPMSFNVLWAAGPDDLFSVGRNHSNDGTPTPPSIGALRLTGMDSSMTTLDIDPNAGFVDDVWGSGPTDVFAAVAMDRILHWDGMTWSSSYAPDLHRGGNVIVPEGLWGTGPNDVFAVGARGIECYPPGGPLALPCSAVAHWDGSSWSTMPVSVTNKHLRAVWGSEPGNVFAVGVAGTIVHWDGKTWAAMSSGSSKEFFSVWGSGPRDVYVVGEAGTILHFDGETWSPMQSGTTASLLRVRGSGRGDVFAIGTNVLLHLRTGSWEVIALPSDFNFLPDFGLPPGFSATTLAVTPSRVFLGGANEILQLDRNGVTCVGPEKNCTDGWDNDCDGVVDGDDPDCTGKVAEQCANSFDDDRNGLTDCADPGCATFPACKHR